MSNKIKQLAIFTLTIIVSQVFAFGTMISAQSVEYTISFEPVNPTLKKGEEVPINLVLNEGSDSQAVELFIVAGEGLEILSFNEAAENTLAANKDNDGTFATLDLAKTDSSGFDEGETLAVATVMLNEEMNTVLEIGAGSKIGAVPFADNSIQIIALDAEGKPVGGNIPESVTEQVGTEVPSDEADDTSNSGDIFDKVAEQLGVERNIAIIIVVGGIALALIIILMLFMTVGRNSADNGSGPKNNSNLPDGNNLF